MRTRMSDVVHVDVDCKEVGANAANAASDRDLIKIGENPTRGDLK
jgi:hypothetical protein